jgi:predicted nucleotidyltransferase
MAKKDVEKKPVKKDEPVKAKSGTKEERIEIVKKYAKKVLEKYKEYVKCIVMMGSVVRDEFKPKSDIDIFLVLDDTAFNLTNEMLDKIDADLVKITEEIPEAWITIKEGDKEEKICLLSIQPSYTLTEFWDYARVAHPIIYNFIKEGVPIYDTGFFAPVKRLLEMGRIPATREAIESYMEGAPKKLTRAKTVKLLMLAEDCYYAMLNSAQAVLMFMGLAPPVPSKAYDEIMTHLVKTEILPRNLCKTHGYLEDILNEMKKNKIDVSKLKLIKDDLPICPKCSSVLVSDYAEWLKEIIDVRKKIEHKEMMEATGAFVDEWIDKADKFVEKMFGLLNALEIRKKEKILERTHEVMIKAAITALKTLKKLPENATDKEVENKIGLPISQAFKKEFVDTKIIEPYYGEIWKKIEGMKKLSDEKKIIEIPDREVYEMREYVRKLIRDLAKFLKEKEISEEK